jgi:hypothetical protein
LFRPDDDRVREALAVADIDPTGSALPTIDIGLPLRHSSSSR